MKKNSLLIVDDDVYVTRLMAELLNDMNFEVHTLNDSTAILDVLEFEKPDAILLDYYMPKQDGLETLSIIKSNKENSFIPVIILTAETEKERLAEFLKLGAVDFLSKPVNFVELEARINSVIKLSHLNKKLKEQLDIIEKKDNETNKFLEIVVKDIKEPLKRMSLTLHELELKAGKGDFTSKEQLNELFKVSENIKFKVSNLIDIMSFIDSNEMDENAYLENLVSKK